VTGLTIIVPTIGRPSLAATIQSIARQIGWDDHVIVVTDGHRPLARDIFERWYDEFPGWEFLELPPDGNWGHGLRNQVLDTLKPGIPVCTIDDDDVYEDGALELMRTAACDKPVIFRMRFGRGHRADGLVVWQQPRLQLGDIGTPMIVAPVCGARFGLSYLGDFDYATALVAELGEPIWRDEVVAHIRPSAVEDT